MPLTHHIQRILTRLSALALGTAACALLGLVLVQGWQVLARYGFNASPSWTEPVTVLLLTTAMSLGAAAGVHHQRHFGFFLLHDRAGARLRRGLDALTALVVAGIGGVVVGWGGMLLLDGWPIKAAGAALPQSIQFLPLALGGGLMALFALNHLFRAIVPPAAQEVD